MCICSWFYYPHFHMRKLSLREAEQFYLAKAIELVRGRASEGDLIPNKGAHTHSLFTITHLPQHILNHYCAGLPPSYFFYPCTPSPEPSYST